MSKSAAKATLKWFVATPRRLWLTITIAVLAVVLGIVLQSHLFQECVQANDGAYPHQAFKEGLGAIIRVRWWCFGIFIDGNGESITALATVALTISTIGLWWVTKRTLGHAQTDSERQAKDMTGALAAATEANEIARETSRAESRAYLVIKGVTLEYYTFNARIEVQIANIGRTPARWTEVEGNIRTLPDTETKATDVVLNATGAPSRWALDPGSEGRGFPVHTDANEGKDLLQIVMAARNKFSIVVQGTVRWETVFGEIFESTFFAWNVPKGPNYEKNAGGDLVQIPEIIPMPSGVQTVGCRLIRGAGEQN